MAWIEGEASSTELERPNISSARLLGSGVPESTDWMPRIPSSVTDKA
jgi:hypothetical protein